MIPENHNLDTSLSRIGSLLFFLFPEFYAIFINAHYSLQMSRFIPETLRKKFSKSSPPPQPAARIALYPNPNPNVVALLERAFAPARNRTPFSHEDFLNRIRATEAESKATGRRWKIIDDSTAQKGTQTEKQAPQTPKQVKIPTWDPSEQPTVIMDNAPFLERCAATRRSAVTSNQETSRRL